MAAAASSDAASVKVERKTAARVVERHAIVGRYGLGVSTQARLQITDAQQRPSVVRLVLHDLLVLQDGSVVLSLLDELLSELKCFFPVERQ